MSKLLTLSIARTSYSGQIPSAITKLVLLQTLLACGMFGEKLYGTLPVNLGNMTELRFLAIGGNKFEGSIPRSLRNLFEIVLHRLAKFRRTIIRGRASVAIPQIY